MPIALPDLEAILREGFPDAQIQIDDLAGDGDHYRARIVSAAFAGLPRIKQHQLVYAALKGKMGGELHALALETAQAEASQARRASAPRAPMPASKASMTPSGTRNLASSGQP